jgi:hypothetical protein
MLKTLAGLFITLHGLVHLWYVALAQRLVDFEPEMGWTGESWLFTGMLGAEPTRMVASVLYIIATLIFIAGGLGMAFRADWAQALLVGAAMFSTVVILLCWDGNMGMLVQKGGIGVLINVGILVALLALN